jgi:hypothetical protein
MTVPRDINQDAAIGGVAQGSGDWPIRRALDLADSTATASAGAATLNAPAGVVTSEALTTAAAAAYTLTLTNNVVEADDLVFASVANGTNTQGIPTLGRVTPGAGSVVITVTNLHASQALNGTLKIAFFVVK